MPPRKRLLTSQELADAIGLSVRTIQRYRSEGLITPALVSLGGHARWDEDEVRAQMRKILEDRRKEEEER
ncbi:helix-turn-helix transcriptional regulator [Pseudonocardia lacus]|uniref:helix-turn-helix transcriptional regulator n=1 Tax=Pseudonocardia lacus TaxID=2835865 RepID=UPI0027E24DBA|nr:helix-turn-helix domain-containing protein [Pseudonocardia lacus]